MWPNNGAIILEQLIANDTFKTYNSNHFRRMGVGALACGSSIQSLLRKLIISGIKERI